MSRFTTASARGKQSHFIIGPVPGQREAYAHQLEVEVQRRAIIHNNTVKVAAREAAEAKLRALGFK